MPKAKDSLKIEVSETTSRETRNIVVTIQAPAQEFLLADLLRQRGAVGSVEMPLKQAVREALQSYLEGTEELIAGLAAGQKRSGNGVKPKGKTVAEGNGVEVVNGTGNGADGEGQVYLETAPQNGASGAVVNL